MPVSHQTMRGEIDRVEQLFRRCGDDPHLDHVAYAFEDLPEDARGQARMLMKVPADGSLAEKVIEVSTNTVDDLYGSLERVKLLHFLSQYPVKPYTYPLDDRLSRGSRPNQAKLATLAAESYTTTVNLCAEMDDGDAPLIREAGLTASLKSHWIPITDGSAPEINQVIEFLQLLAEPGTGRAYVHCEAGKGRTGVITACYRMAVMGWSPQDAQLEAENFGCSIPDQLRFIQDVGTKLAQEDPALNGYPREALGSHRPTASEQDATIAEAAASSPGEIK